MRESADKGGGSYSLLRSLAFSRDMLLAQNASRYNPYTAVSNAARGAEMFRRIAPAAETRIGEDRPASIRGNTSLKPHWASLKDSGLRSERSPLPKARIPAISNRRSSTSAAAFESFQAGHGRSRSLVSHHHNRIAPMAKLIPKNYIRPT